jgi:hypothetical protein
MTTVEAALPSSSVKHRTFARHGGREIADDDKELIASLPAFLKARRYFQFDPDKYDFRSVALHFHPARADTVSSFHPDVS